MSISGCYRATCFNLTFVLGSNYNILYCTAVSNTPSLDPLMGHRTAVIINENFGIYLKNIGTYLHFYLYNEKYNRKSNKSNENAHYMLFFYQLPINGAVFEPDILNKKCIFSRFFVTINVSIKNEFPIIKHDFQ